MFVRYVIFLRYVNEKNCVFLDPHFFRDYVERKGDRWFEVKLATT